MQFTLVKHHHMSLRERPIPAATQTTFIFDHHMATSVNKINNRFRRAPYIRQWIFKKPYPTTSELPATSSNWVSALREIVQSSLVRPTTATTPLHTDNLILTSTLDSESSSDEE